ncbi:A24 family peptidase [Vibrio europaeus]|uniref:A24 family peptidase n=1 Tax=Vibrio europaeus TaxID=300876 RepID=UPI002341B321|nr:A24 family peptidase [Vibrio europaeus]MDC5847721.1 A24 family peptidase [Vibrio europaeus]
MDIWISYLIWIGFIIVAVSDAREHRIPNLYLLMILCLCLVEVLFSPEPLDNLLWSTLAGLIFFGTSLLLHLMRVMAPGDVKLLGVVGFWLGWGHLLEATAWIALSSVLVGLLYAIMNRVHSGSSVKQLLTKYSILVTYGPPSQAVQALSKGIERKLRMPFAPVVVLGLAMYQYF